MQRPWQGLVLGPQQGVSGSIQRPLQSFVLGWQTQRRLRQIRRVAAGRQLAVVQQAFFGMHFRLHGFLPFGQGAAVAGHRPRNPATDPAATPLRARRERTTVMSRVTWSNVDDSMMILHGEGCVASRCTGPDSASQWDHN